MNMTPYTDRRTWLMDVCELKGWKLKLYAICAEGCELEQRSIEAAMRYAEEHVNWPETETRCGFITLHIGEEAIWFLVDTWVEDILHHNLFRAPLSSPEQFEPGPSDATMACVWEMSVMLHERDAWVRHVMSNPAAPDLIGWEADCLELR